ncbi:MAG: hypothetical protein WC864_04925 [Ilumatobacteraceae bacterium]
MSLEIHERELTAGQSRIGTVVIGVIALLLLFPSVRSAIGFNNKDTKCEPWPSKQGEWYSVNPALLEETAGYPRMVDKSGIWAKGGFGLTEGWVYVAKTPDGPLAYWAVSKGGMPQMSMDGGEPFTSFWALNDEAISVMTNSRQSYGSITDQAKINLMLTDRIKDSIKHCLGY